MSNLIVKDENGNPVFLGKEESRPEMRMELSKMTCPQCQTQVDYLLGNVRQGCESCYDKLKDEPEKGGGFYDKNKELEY
jgi:protein-arginine kinase activator protein McsA